MSKRKTPIGSMGKTAYARTVFPHLCPERAKRLLHDAIVDNPTLLRRLRALGWSNTKRYFTPEQMRVLKQFHL